MTRLADTHEDATWSGSELATELDVWPEAVFGEILDREDEAQSAHNARFEEDTPEEPEPEAPKTYEEALAELAESYEREDAHDVYRPVSPLRRALVRTALVVIALAIVGALAYFGLRTGVANSTTTLDELGAPISYDLIYEDGSDYQNSYEAAEAYLATRSNDWFATTIDVDDSSEVAGFASAFNLALYDDPIGATLYPSASVNHKDPALSNDFEQSVQVQDGALRVYSALFEGRDAAADVAAVTARVEAITKKGRAVADGRAFDYLASCYAQLATTTHYPKEKTTKAWYANSIYGALVEGESQCVGVSLAYKACLDAAGVPNFVASGTVNGNGHAWNVVYFDGAWYACDLTMADSSLSEHKLSYGNLMSRLMGKTDGDRAHYGFLIELDTYTNGGTVASENSTITLDPVSLNPRSEEVIEAYEALVR